MKKEEAEVYEEKKDVDEVKEEAKAEEPAAKRAKVEVGQEDDADEEDWEDV